MLFCWLFVSLGKSKEGLGLLERGVPVHPQSVDIVLRQLLPGLGIPMLQGVKNGRVVGIVAHDGVLPQHPLKNIIGSRHDVLQNIVDQFVSESVSEVILLSKDSSLMRISSC